MVVNSANQKLINVRKEAYKIAAIKTMGIST